MEPVSLESRIDAVTVYAQGARVARAAVLARNGGYPDTVVLGGLPLCLRDDSVRVRVEADGAGLPPTATDVHVTLDAPAADANQRPAVGEALEAARADERRLAALVEQVRRELGRLGQLKLAARAAPKDEAPPATPADARLALIELREREVRALTDELVRLQKELDDAQRHRADLEAEDFAATSARQVREHELRKAAVIHLSSGVASAPGARVVIEYQVPGARWAPAYALRMDRGMTRAHLEMRAVIAQRTGEDWSGVGLTVSTADMQRWTELPELHSVRIGRRQPPVQRAGWRPPPDDTAELFRDWDRAFRGKLQAPAPSSGTATAVAEEPVDELLDEPEVPAPRYGSPLVELALQEQEAMHEERVREELAMIRPAVSKRGGLLGGLFGGSGSSAPVPKRAARAAPPPAPAAAPSGAMPPQAMMSTLAGGYAAAPEPPPEPEPDGLAVGDALLRYGELRMAPPDSERRGHLTIASRQEVYLELLVAQEISVEADVLSALARAERRAGELDDSALPAGCHYVWSRDYDHAYPAATHIDVPSDGSFHAVALAAADADVRRRYVVVPRESCDVFRTAELDNPIDAPLLSGPVDVYLGDDFLLTAPLDTTAARGRLELGLGVEQGIKVARNTRFREESAGLMGGSLELHHQIVVDINNNLDQPAPMEVRERVPIVPEAQEDDIKLNVGAVSPPWQPYEQTARSAGEPELEGGYRWRVEVGAGASTTVRAEYVVKISSKQELVGGNRREA